MTTRVVLTLYRELIRFTRKPIVKNSKFILPLLDAQLEKYCPAKRIRNSEGLYREIRRVFREEMNLTDNNEKNQRIDDGFLLLRLLHIRIIPVLETIKNRRESSTNREKIKYRIGEVVWNKEQKCRSIIIGWDHRPEIKAKGRSLNQLSHLKYGLDQPFYLTFSNTLNDSIYVAEECLESLPIEARQIPTNLFHEMFEGYDKFSGVFIPCEQLLFQYPKDYDPELTKEQRELQHRQSLSILESIRPIIQQKYTELSDQIEKIVHEQLSPFPELKKGWDQFLAPLFPNLRSENVEGLDSTNQNLDIITNFQNLLMEILKLLSKRELVSAHPQKFLYSIGDFVTIKQFDTGVIYDWAVDRSTHHLLDPNAFQDHFSDIFYDIFLDHTNFKAIPSICYPQRNLQVLNPASIPNIPDELLDNAKNTNNPNTETTSILSIEDSEIIFFHSNLAKFFIGYDTRSNRFIPQPHISFAFPTKSNSLNTSECEAYEQIYQSLKWECEEALKDLTRLMDPQNPTGILQGLLCLQRNLMQFDQAQKIREFLLLIHEYPSNAEFRSKLSQVANLMNYDKYDKARVILTALLEKDPHSVEVLFQLCYLNMKTKNYDDVLKYAKLGIELCSHHIGLRVSLARALWELERFEESISEYKVIFSIDPWYPYDACKLLESEFKPEDNK